MKVKTYRKFLDKLVFTADIIEDENKSAARESLSQYGSYTVLQIIIYCDGVIIVETINVDHDREVSRKWRVIIITYH